MTPADRLVSVLEPVSERLFAIPEAEADRRPEPDRWSKKEILGHLIDSASNNHHRIVRALLEPGVAFPGYEQDGWIRTQAYRSESWSDLVNLWLALNRHLAHIIRAIPEPALAHECVVGSKPSIPLTSLIEGYLDHLQHHLQQVLDGLKPNTTTDRVSVSSPVNRT